MFRDRLYVCIAVSFAAAAAILILQPGTGRACINDGEEGGMPSRENYATQIAGLLRPPRFDIERSLQTALAYEQNAELQKSWAAGVVDTGWSERNDYALALIYSGRAEEARDVWIGMEQAKPGEYMIAANLGTAYELTGENELALKWISEGLKRQPDSHFGTEWLHARILEGKIALASDPQWLEKNRVSGANFELKDGKPVGFSSVSTDNVGRAVQLADMRKALQYQLKERLKFLRDPDPMVAQLLVDFGHAELLSGSPESARLVYARAIEYGAPEAELAVSIKHADLAMQPWIIRNWYSFAAATLLLLALIVLLIQRAKSNAGSVARQSSS